MRNFVFYPFLIILLICLLPGKAKAQQAKSFSGFVAPNSTQDAIWDPMYNDDFGLCTRNTIEVSLTTMPSHAINGSVYFDTDKKLHYRPQSGYAGMDSLRYSIYCPGSGVTSTATVYIYVYDKPDNIYTGICAIDPPPFDWEINQITSNIDNSTVHVASVPLVGDIDGDGRIEIILANSNESGLRIFEVNPTTNVVTLQQSLTTPAFRGSDNSYVIAKLTGDTYASIFLVSNTNVTSGASADRGYRLYKYTFNGFNYVESWYKSFSTTASFSAITPIVADFCRTGAQQVAVFDKLYDAQTGTLLVNGGFIGVSNRFFGRIPHPGASNANPAGVWAAADIDNDGNLEIIAGVSVYKIAYNGSTWTYTWLRNADGTRSTSNSQATTRAANIQNGTVAIADMDGDGYLDVVTTWASNADPTATGNSATNGTGTSKKGYVAIWNPRTGARMSNIVEINAPVASAYTGYSYAGPSQAFIGDLTGDGKPNIALTACRAMAAYSYTVTGTPGATNSGTIAQIWNVGTTDNSASTVMSLFDFDQDKSMELVYRDETHLRILNGIDGSDKTVFTGGLNSSTWDEYPVVADIDGDGESEIITTGGTATQASSGSLKIFKSGGTTMWAPSRPVWNTYYYNPVYINNDLTVPQFPVNPATPFYDSDGNVSHPFNNYLQQPTSLSDAGSQFLAGPDLSFDLNTPMRVENYTDNNGRAHVIVNIKNGGASQYPANSVLQVLTYTGNLSSDGITVDPASRVLRDTRQISLLQPINPEAVYNYEYDINNVDTFTNYTLWEVYLNAIANYPSPSFPSGSQECEYTNNNFVVQIPHVVSQTSIACQYGGDKYWSSEKSTTPYQWSIEGGEILYYSGALNDTITVRWNDVTSPSTPTTITFTATDIYTLQPYSATLYATVIANEKFLEDKLWYFGQDAANTPNTPYSTGGSPGIIFNGTGISTDPYVASSESGISKVRASGNSLSVNSPYCPGQAIFYVQNDSVYNYLNQSIGKITANSAVSDGLAACYLGNNKYLLFAVSTTGGDAALNYYLVDMIANNGKGAITATNTILSSGCSEAIEVVPMIGSTNEYWLINHLSSGNLQVRKINPVTPYLGTVATVASSINTNTTSLRRSMNDSLLSLVSSSSIRIYNFNALTGTITAAGTALANSSGFNHVAFSKNYVYATATSGTLTQWALSNYAQTGSISSSGSGDIKMGPDGKLYVLRSSSNYVGVVENPEQPITTGGFYTQDGLNLGMTTGTVHSFSTGITRPYLSPCEHGQNPVAEMDQKIFCRVSGSVTINVLQNDNDPDGNRLYITNVDFVDPANYEKADLTFNAADSTVTLTLKTPTSVGTGYVFDLDYEIKNDGAPLSRCTTGILAFTVGDEIDTNNIIVSDTTVCYGTSASLKAAVSGVADTVFRWYASQTSTQILHTGGFYQTGILTNDTAFYVAVEGLNYCENAFNNRKQVSVTVEQLPVVTITSTSPVTRCGEGDVTLTATVNTSAIIQWYSQATGGTAIGTGTPITINNVPVGTRKYYAQAINNTTSQCISALPRDSVTVTVTPLATEAMITAADVTICTGNTATLTASLSASGTGITNRVFRWYSSMDPGATVLAEGDSYTTGALTAISTRDTVFYVSVVGTNYCENLPADRKLVKVTVNEFPTLKIVADQDTICYPGAFTLRAQITGFTMAAWFGWYLPNGQLAEGTTRFSPAPIGNNVDMTNFSSVYTLNQQDLDSNDITLRLRVNTGVCGYIIDSIALTILPYPTSAAVELITEPQTLQDMCIDTVYAVKITATGEGEVTQMKVTFEDTWTSLITVKDAYYYTYDASGNVNSSGIQLIQEYNDYPVSSTKRWGFPSGFILDPGDSVLVEVTVAAECGIFTGNNYRILLNGYGICGSVPIPQAFDVTEEFYTKNDTSAFSYEIYNVFTPPYATAQMGDTITWRATFYPKGEGYVSNLLTDSIVTLTPAGLNAVEFSYRPLVNSVARDSVKMIYDENGLELSMPIRSGLVEGDSIVWEFEFTTTEAACGEYEIYSEVYYNVVVECGTSTEECSMNARIGSDYPVILVDRYQYELVLDQSIEGIGHMIEGKWYGSYPVKAITEFFAGDTINIDFYIDWNNNSQLDPADLDTIYRFNYVTEDVNPNDTFIITVDAGILIEPGHQLLAHVHSASLCEDAVLPVVVLSGPEEVCQRDTTIFFTASNMSDYFFSVEAISGATPRRIPLEGKSVYSNTDDSVRVVWRTEGEVKIKATYTVFGGTPNAKVLSGVDIDVVVKPAPFLAFTSTDSISICFGTPLELTQYVRDTTNIAGVIINFYANNVKVGDNSGGSLYVEPHETTIYTIEAVTGESCSSNILEFKVVVSEVPVVSTITVLQQPDCLTSTGSLELVISNGSGNYEYNLDGGAVYSNLQANGSGKYVISGLKSGSYVVYLNDKANLTCPFFSEPITLSPVSSSLIAKAVVIDTAVDCSSANGTIQIIANEGIAPYKYTVNGGAEHPLPGNGIIGTDFSAGKYYVTVIDATGCVYALDEIIVWPVKGMTVTLVQTQPAVCESLGMAKLVITGGVAPYSYRLNGQGWKPLGTIPAEGVESTLPSGYNEMIVRDNAGCEMIATCIISQGGPGAVSLNQLTINDATCDGINNGSFVLSVSGTNPNPEYSIDGGMTYHPVTIPTTVIPGLSVGSYEIRLRDGAGCVSDYKNIRIRLTKEATINIGSISVERQPECGANTGSISVVVYGGSGQYDYNFDGSNSFTALAANGIINNLPAGAYRVYVRDRNALACPIVLSASVRLTPSNTDLIVDATPFPTSDCSSSNGSVQLVINGGTSPYYYQIQDETPVLLPNNGLITGLASGFYTIKITDGAGCVAFSNKVLVQPVDRFKLSWSIEKNATCSQKGEILLSVSGGEQLYFYWMEGEDRIFFPDTFAIIPLSAGMHVIYLTDSAGCIISDAEVTMELDNNDLAISDISVTDANCDGTGGGKIIFTASGSNIPLSYRINNGAYQTITNNTDTILNVSEGNYTLFLKDKDSCVISYSNIAINTIKEPSVKINAIYVDTQPTCSGNGSIRLALSGGSGSYVYKLNTQTTFTSLASTGIIGNLTPGTYQVTVRDAATLACPPSISDWITLEASNSDLTLQTNITDASSCTSADGKIQLILGGGVTPYTYRIGTTGAYQSIPANGIIDNLPSGEYLVMIQDMNGCTASALAEIKASAGMGISLEAKTLATCDEEGTFLIRLNGGDPLYSYKLDYTNYITFAGDTILVSARAGYHLVTVKDANGCMVSDTITLMQSSGAYVELDTITSTLCDASSGASVTFRAVGPERPLSYSVDGNSTVTIPSSGDIVISNLAAGTHWVLFNYANGCTFEVNGIKVRVITTPDIIIKSIFAVAQPPCEALSETRNGTEGKIQVMVEGGSGSYLYNFDKGDTKYPLSPDGVISGLIVGNYKVYIWDALGETCAPVESNSIDLLSDNTSVQVRAIVTPALSCNVNEIDKFGSITIEAFGGQGKLQYLIGTGYFSDIPIDGNIGNYPTGEYSVIVQDEYGCISTVNVIITVAPEIYGFEMSATPATCEGKGVLTLTLDGTNQNTNYYFIDGQQLTPFVGRQAVEYISAGWHEVFVEDNHGCLTSDTIYVPNTSGLSVELTGTKPATCQGLTGGEIYLNITGGATPMSYYIAKDDNGDIIEVPIASNGSLTISGLSIGTYYITITDANGCIVTYERIIIDRDIHNIETVDNRMITYRDRPVKGNLISDDDEHYHGVLTLVSHSLPNYGTITIDTASGFYVYVPNTDYVGRDTVKYFIAESCGFVESGYLFVVVLDDTLTDKAPVAIDIYYQTITDVPIIIPDMRFNDIDPNGGVLQNATIVQDVSNGVLTHNGDGTYTYEPAFGWEGIDRFTYSVCNDKGLCDTATAYVYVYPDGASENFIIPLTDYYSLLKYDTLKQTDLALGILGNDSWPQGTTPVITVVTAPEHGTLSMNTTDGTFTYVADLDYEYSGPDYFVYELCAGSFPCDTAYVYFFIAERACIDQVNLVMLHDTLSICSGDSISLLTAIDLDNTQNLDTVKFYLDNNYTIPLTDVYVKTQGSYYLEALNVYQCAVYDSVYVIVNDLPQVSIIGSDSICVGTTTIVYSQSPGTWVSSDSNIAALRDGGVVLGKSVGNVTFTFTNELGCSSGVEINVGEFPVVSPIVGERAVCENASITLTSATSGGIWKVSNDKATISDPDANPVTVNGVTKGQVYVSYTVGEGVCKTTQTYSLKIEPAVNEAEIIIGFPE